MLLINFVYGLTMEIVRSDYASGVLQVSTNEPGIARLTFPDLMFPYLHHHKDRIKKIEKKTNNLYVYMLIGDIIEIKYSKVLKNIHEYGWKIERGIIIPSAILYDGKQLYISNKLVDIIYIPDFTVPFLAFNTCGAVFTVVFSIFIKKRFKSK